MRPTGAFDRTRLAVATGSSSGPRVTSTPGATTSVTQLTPATGPANTTLPAVGARTSSPTGAATSIPRCPGPYGPAHASNPRTTGPVTGIHNAGTRGDRGSTGAHEERRPATATGAAAGGPAGATTPAARSAASSNVLQPRPGLAAASGYEGDMGLPGDRTRWRRSDCPGRYRVARAGGPSPTRMWTTTSEGRARRQRWPLRLVWTVNRTAPSWTRDSTPPPGPRRPCPPGCRPGGGGRRARRRPRAARRGSGARVRLLVDAAEPLVRDVRVGLGRGQGDVAQQLLHPPQVGTSLQQVGCQAVAERVPAGPGGRSGRQPVPLEHPANVPLGHRPPPPI